MFGKIKDKLKGAFQKTEEIVEENPDEVVEQQETIEQQEVTPKKETKSKKSKESPEKLEEDNSTSEEESPVSEKKEDEEKSGFFSKTFKSLKSKKITQDDFEKIWLDLEILLLEINIAYEIVEKIEQKLRDTLIGESFSRFGLSETIRNVMSEEVAEVLSQREGDFLGEVKKHKEKGEPLVILMLGVNGTGKTTSIAKLIQYLKYNQYSVAVAAADTFRAAAVDQLEKHCKNLEVKCISHKNGSDPAAVAYDAVDHAKAKGVDIVLVDTAGRMPNNSNLMMELQKVKRVSGSQMALFIGDSIAGNDLIDQISLFDKGVEIDGVILTKVDTDERPGSVVTTAYSIEKPIYFLGTGQGYEDFVLFEGKNIAKKLFEE